MQSTSDAIIIPAISAVPGTVNCPTRIATVTPTPTAIKAHQRDKGRSTITIVTKCALQQDSSNIMFASPTPAAPNEQLSGQNLEKLPFG